MTTRGDRRSWGDGSKCVNDRRDNVTKNRQTRMMSEWRELGSATAEVAVLFPSIVLLLAVVIWVGSVGAAQVAVQQAAREVAREIARGQELETSAETAQRVAGDDVSVHTSGSGSLTQVTVGKDVSFGGIDWLTLHVSAEASVLGEVQ